VIQQWLSLVLDVSTAMLAIIVAALAISLRRDSSLTGIALVNIVSFNSSLRSIIVSWSIAETSIGAVSRVKQLEDDVIPEALADETVLPPETWPESGSIDIKGVTAVYEYAIFFQQRWLRHQSN
jgi:ATP-binding cassette subfamily C (CFTR/MRP) protein 1